MLLYRSCYPIRMDDAVNVTYCAKNSVGMNIRFYDVSIGELNTRNSGIESNKFDLWREIYYYEYVREEILKPNVCPHFIMLYCYYMTSNTGIKFNQLRGIKSKYLRENYNQLSLEQMKKLNEEYRRAVSDQLGI